MGYTNFPPDSRALLYRPDEPPLPMAISNYYITATPTSPLDPTIEVTKTPKKKNNNPMDITNGVVIRSQSGFYHVHTSVGRIVCQMRGELKTQSF